MVVVWGFVKRGEKREKRDPGSQNPNVLQLYIHTEEQCLDLVLVSSLMQLFFVLFKTVFKDLWSLGKS